jgi:hypothetical protein
MSNGARVGENRFSGKLYRTTGPAFDAAQWDPAKVGVTEEGRAIFTFSDRANATFEFSPKGADFWLMQRLTRYVFASPPTICN